MFFETVGGDLIPVSRIKRISEAATAHGDPRWTVELINDEEVLIGISTKHDLDAIPVGSFPAFPGTSVLRVGSGEMFAWPVIGWVIPRSGNPLPVTTDGINDGAPTDEYLPILLPDGRVYRPEDSVYSLEDFKQKNGIHDAVITLNPEEVPGLAELIATHQKS